MLTSAYIDDLQIHGGADYGLTAFQVGSPAPRAVTDLRPSEHGATDDTRYYGPRTIEVVGRILADSTADLWPLADALKAALRLGSWHVLKFRRAGLTQDERCLVRVDSPVDMPLVLGSTRMLQYGVSLFAADPRLYSDTLSSGSYDPTDSGTGGLAFPLDFPLDFDVADGSAQLSVVNEGTISTPPSFTITGPVTNPTIDNDTTGESIYTQELALASGDILTLDVATRTVLLAGTTSRPDLIDVSRTDWFYLATGTNLLRLRGSGMSAGETGLSVTFRSARI
jgi:Siphovirus-type tail component, C-terminal domain